MADWKEYKLKEIIEHFIDYRGKTPTKTESGVPLITAKIVKDGRIIEPNEFIATDNYKSWMTRGYPEINDVVLTTEAPLGEVALLKNKNVALAQRIITLRGKKETCSNIFLKYYLQSNLGQFALQARASGSTVEGIKASELREVEITLPPLAEQQAIAEVLSSLDAKIDLLHRQNKTLEAMAETLFRQWFVEEVEASWEVAKIGDVLRAELGGTPSTTKPEYWDGDVSWINSGEVNKFRIIESSRFITKLGLEKSNCKLLPKGTTVLAITGATLGQVSLLEIDTCANQSVVGIIPNERISKEYVFLWVKHKIEEIIMNETGGAQPHINKNDVNETEIVIPPKDQSEEKLKILSDYFEKITKNVFQIRSLTKLRDELLPKLISGDEVRVKM